MWGRCSKVSSVRLGHARPFRQDFPSIAFHTSSGIGSARPFASSESVTACALALARKQTAITKHKDSLRGIIVVSCGHMTIRRRRTTAPWLNSDSLCLTSRSHSHIDAEEAG
jgi:hypothetical protein